MEGGTIKIYKIYIICSNYMKYKKIQRSILKVQQPTNKSFKKRKQKIMEKNNIRNFPELKI